MKKNLVKVLSLVLVLVVAISCMVAFTACNKPEKLKIAAQNATSGFFYAEEFTNMELQGYDKYPLACNALVNGNLEVVIADKQAAAKLAENIKGLKVIDINLTDEEYAFCIDKKQPKLKDALNNFLVKEDGTMNPEVATIIANNVNGTSEFVYTNPTDAVLKDLSDDQKLVVSTEAGFAPFESVVGKGFQGIDIEILAKFAELEKKTLVIENMEFDAVVSSVGANGVDIAAAALTVTEDRAKIVDFTKTYFKTSQVVIVKDTNTKFDDCKTKADVENVLKSL